MTAHKGRLESQAIIVPVGGWTAAINDGTVFNATVAAGTYSPTTLAAAFEAALEAGSAAVYSHSIANGEGGSGALTLVCDSDFAVTWTSTDLRDALGFAGDLGGGGTDSTYTGTLGMRGLWLPDSPLAAPYVSGDSGHWEGGPTQTVSPLGQTKTITRPTRVKAGPFRWSHVSAARSRQYSETGVPRSFERFIRDTMFGQVGYVTPGGKVRLYWDADAAGYVEFWPMAPTTTETRKAVEGWAGLYDLSIEGWRA